MKPCHTHTHTQPFIYSPAAENQNKLWNFQDEKNESFVKHFMDAEGSALDKENLAFVLRDLAIGGTDTTLTILLWFLVLMANHRSVQDRLHAEIDSVVGRGRRPELDDRKRFICL